MFKVFNNISNHVVEMEKITTYFDGLQEKREVYLAFQSCQVD